MRVFMSESTRNVLASAAILGGVMLVGGQPVGQVEGEEVGFFTPRFFSDWTPGRCVLCPEVSPLGDYSVTLFTDDGDEVVAKPTKGGWEIRVKDVAGEEPVITWFERFC